RRTWGRCTRRTRSRSAVASASSAWWWCAPPTWRRRAQCCSEIRPWPTACSRPTSIPGRRSTRAARALARLLLDERLEVREHPVGQPPDRLALHTEAGEREVLAAVAHVQQAAIERAEQVVEWDPMHAGDLRGEHVGVMLVEPEHVGRDRQVERAHAAHRAHLVERAEIAPGARQVDPDLLARLADRRLAQVGVVLLGAPAGEAH